MKTYHCKSNRFLHSIDVRLHIGVYTLNTVELSSQEAAWYLLRESVPESSVFTVTIPTVRPSERQCIRKTNKELDKMDIDGAPLIYEIRTGLTNMIKSTKD